MTAGLFRTPLRDKETGSSDDGGRSKDAVDEVLAMKMAMDDNLQIERGTDEPPTPRFSLSQANHLSLDDVEPVDVQIQDLSVTVDTSPSVFEPSTWIDLWTSKFGSSSGDALTSKTLIQSVSASLKPGTLTAIIGGSGSGKTTLLNTLSERMISSRLHQTGSATFNGRPGVNTIRHAYVMQADILLPTLTVRETLSYAASLRLPPPCTATDRERAVNDVIQELGLKECANTRIGDSQHKGCSGGEKRRVTIGVQLLSNPSVLFLDEPTTGLDATSAFQLVRTLKVLAARGRTVITTIHQPRSEIWGLFDNLIVLSRGKPVYVGEKDGCVDWFASVTGAHIPDFVNPAEWVIDLAAVDTRTPELEEESSARVERLTSAWAEESRKVYGGNREATLLEGAADQRRKNEGKQVSFVRQVRVLAARTLKVTYRDPMGMVAAIFEAILMGIITGYIFYNLPADLSGIRSRQGALYTASGLQGYLFLIFEIYRLTIDMPVFDRERSEGCVSPVPWILSRRLARLVTEDVPAPFLFSIIFYFMAGFEREVTKFFTFFAIVLVNHYIAVACATSCVATVRHFAGSSLIGNLIYTLQSLACGYFVSIETLPVWLRWTKWITYTFYIFSSFCGNEFASSFYDCPADPSTPDNPACAPYTGQYIMNSLGFPPNWTWRPIVAATCFVPLFLIIATIALYALRTNLSVTRAKTNETDLAAGKEKMVARSIQEAMKIDMGLEKFALDLSQRSAFGKRIEPKVILCPVSATFQAGELNVVMGPSGSGKTSLLNSIAGRLVDTPRSRYVRSGCVKFNGAVPSESVVRSVVSFVAQDDDALLSSLTVRETLRYAAQLRLPSHMSKADKIARAEDVLLKMGLKDCADIVVGNELKKGISGGEKRRVSIAVQILTDPRVLLLDEPTSGLDAFTAASIMEVLKGLASEGRTLILTIHQARSDLWHTFGNVLLLARGGNPVYAGKAAEMLNWFKSLGHKCPTHTNPADFALDLITIDLQREDREEESRQRVDGLVKAWENQVDRELGGSWALNSEKNDTPLPAPRCNPADDAEAANAESSALALKPTHSHIPPPRHSFSRPSLSLPAELALPQRKRAPLSVTVPVLLSRATLNLRRQPDLIMARLMQVFGMGIVFTIFFAPIGNSYSSVQTRVGFVQELGAFYFVGLLQNVAVYPMERNVAYSEHADGVYGLTVWLLTYTFLEIPFEIVACAAFGILVVFAVGLPRTGEVYGYASVVCFAIVSCGESAGIVFNSLFASHTGFAVTMAGVVLSVANTMAGVMSIEMPALLKGANYISPLRYAVRTMAPASLKGVNFTCTPAEEVGGRCPIETGRDVLELYQLDVNPAVNLAALVGLMVAYRVVAWALLKAVKGRWRGWRKRRRESQKAKRENR